MSIIRAAALFGLLMGILGCVVALFGSNETGVAFVAIGAFIRTCTKDEDA